MAGRPRTRAKRAAQEGSEKPTERDTSRPRAHVHATRTRKVKPKDPAQTAAVDSFLNEAIGAVNVQRITTEAILAMVIYRIATGEVAPGVESNFLRIALDCRKQIFIESGGEDNTRIVCEHRYPDAMPLASLVSPAADATPLPDTEPPPKA